MFLVRIGEPCVGREDHAMPSPDTSGSTPIARQTLAVLDQRAGIDYLDSEYRLADVVLVGGYSSRPDRTKRRDDGGH